MKTSVDYLTENSAHIGAEFRVGVQTQPGVDEAIQHYRERSHHARPEDCISARTDVKSTLEAYAGSYFKSKPEIYAVAELSDLLDKLNNTQLDNNVRRSLGRLLQVYGADSQEYKTITDMATDFAVINDSMSEWLNNPRGIAYGNHELHEALNARSEVTEDMWLGDPLQPDLMRLNELAGTVNIETMLVKAAHALEELYKEDLSETAQLRLIAAIETYYAPYCEITGFDALAARLLNRANEVRLQNGGRKDLLDKAQEILDGMGELAAVERGMHQLPELLFATEVETEKIISPEDEHNHNAAFAFSLVEHFGKDISCVSRVKAVGTLARKLQMQERRPEQFGSEGIPADLVGFTAIYPDGASVIEGFADVIRRIDTMPGVRFIAAPSRKETLYTKGQPEFKAAVTKAVNQVQTSQELYCDKKESNFEVAKFAIEVPTPGVEGATMRVEVQFVHALSRMNARVGRESHILYKLEKYGNLSEENRLFIESGQATECMQRIRARKEHMSDAHSIGNTDATVRGDVLRKSIARHALNLGQVAVN